MFGKGKERAEMYVLFFVTIASYISWIIVV